MNRSFLLMSFVALASSISTTSEAQKPGAIRRESIHTQTVEGFWSLVKHGVVATFHKVCGKYLPLYVAEFQFRYNSCMNADIFGTAIPGC
jgi:hypothetical protein